MSAPRVTRTNLSDGRELLYFDSPGAPERTATDERGLPTVHTTSTLRRDPLTGDWVVYAAHRQNRTFLPPANEDPLAPTRPGAKPSEIPEDSYEVAVFENRFPSLSMHQDGDCAELVDGEELFPQAPARARCEVVCFTPDAEGSFAQLPVERKRLLIDVWAHRTAELSAIDGVQQVFPFENRGEEIGVTLHHPHGQIYSYPFVPPRAAAIARQAESFREAHDGESLFDAVVAAELRAGTRVVAQTDHFVVFTPAAAKWPVEVMVMATRAVPNFAELTEEERDDLAGVLDRLFRAVEGYFEGVERLPYIAAWNQAPVDAPEDGRLTLQLFSLMRSPNRMKFLAGSESGMGVWINDTTPEKIAARLRELWGETPAGAGVAGAGAGVAGAGAEPDVFEHVHTDSELDREARELFSSKFGAEPEGTWIAPGRVNVIGDHVDYAGGLCLPFALGISTVVAASRRDDRVVRVAALGPDGESWEASVDLDQIAGEGGLPDFRGYTAGTVWALGASGMDIALVSDVPVGSGLSSSAAVECAVAVAASDLYGLGGVAGEGGREREDALIDAAIRAENEVVGASTGGLDQRTVVSAKEGQALVLDFLEGDYRQVPWTFDGLHLVVANTRAPHSHVSGGYATRRGLVDAVAESCGGLKAFRDEAVVEEAAGKADTIGSDAELIRRRVRHVVTEIRRTREAVGALESNDPELFGELMNQSHDSLRDDFEIVTPELESAVQAARKAGALGARVTGGGFGGSIVALCADPAAVGAAIVKAAEDKGFPRPQIFVALPESGARRLS